MTDPIRAADRAQLIAELIEVGLPERAAHDAIARGLRGYTDNVDDGGNLAVDAAFGDRFVLG